MLVSPYPHGATRVGFIPMTRAVGSNGIVAIILADACQKRMLARSSAGKPSGATSPRSSGTVNQVIRRVDRASGRHCFIGRTIAEKFEYLPAVASSHQEDTSLGPRIRPAWANFESGMSRWRRFQNRI